MGFSIEKSLREGLVGVRTPAGHSEFGVSIIHSLIKPRMAFWYPMGS